MAETMQPPLASASTNSAWFHALRSTRSYDLVARVVFICGIMFLALPSAVGVATRLGGHPGAWDLALLADVLARTGVLLFFVLAALLVLVRVRPVSKAHGLQPRLSALAGSFLLMSMALFPRHDLTISLNLLSAALIFLGHMLAVFALAWLGRSFSIMAEARRLVTEGPYTLVRHPLYAAEAIAALGLFLQYASPWTALLMAVSLAFQLQRMRNEERDFGRDLS